jgi:hypothetical protein
MTELTTGFRRWLASALLLLGLTLCPAMSGPAWAQMPPDQTEPAEGESKGRPLDGYLATILFVMLAFFIVGKSARR